MYFLFYIKIVGTRPPPATNQLFETTMAVRLVRFCSQESCSSCVLHRSPPVVCLHRERTNERTNEASSKATDQLPQPRKRPTKRAR